MSYRQSHRPVEQRWEPPHVACLCVLPSGYSGLVRRSRRTNQDYANAKKGRKAYRLTEISFRLQVHQQHENQDNRRRSDSRLSL